MWRTMSSWERPAAAVVTTCSPSRITVTSSATRRISSSRWEMKRMETPRCLSELMTAKSRSASEGVREAVGSSRISSFRSAHIARTISTNWISATVRPARSERGSMSTPSSASRREASAYILRASTVPSRVRGWKPRKMFSATSRCGKSFGSW